MLVSVKTAREASASDEELLSALAAGDESALGPLYRRHVPMVYKMAAQALDPEAAEDIVQEVFASVWKNAESFDSSRGPVRPWILQIARSRVLNELRRRSRKPGVGERDGSELDELPDDIRDQMSNVAITVEDEPPDGQPLLGLYQGVPWSRSGRL